MRLDDDVDLGRDWAARLTGTVIGHRFLPTPIPVLVRLLSNDPAHRWNLGRLNPDGDAVNRLGPSRATAIASIGPSHTPAFRHRRKQF